MLYLSVLALYLFLYLLIRAEYINLKIRVKVPAYTSEDVYVIGNLDCLGNWKKFSHKMKKGDGGIYETSIRVSKGKELSFKFTLGSWDTEEKGPRFEKLENRSFQVTKSEIIEFEIANFGGFEWESGANTRTGNFQFLRHFPSNILNSRRNVILYLPPSYFKDQSRRYPVIYMHDGNNIFDAHTAFMGVEWEVDEAAETLMTHGAIQEAIIVGVYNTPNRMDEYTPTHSKRYGGGRGDLYIRFLIEELMPAVNAKFRTLTGREHTGIMGSSLGGLISLYAGLAYPDVFSMIGSISPSLWWDDRYMERDFVLGQKHHGGMKIWLDMGTREGMNSQGYSMALEDTRRMSALLQKIGYVQGEDLFYFEHRGAGHDEASWAARIHLPLLFFLSDAKDQSLWKIPLPLSLPDPQSLMLKAS